METTRDVTSPRNERLPWWRRVLAAVRAVTPAGWDAVIVWLVALAAAVLSYDALVQLAAGNGARGALAYVWPLVLDLAALGFLRKWLSGRDLSALTVTLSAVATVFVAGLSIAGNVVDHTAGRAPFGFDWWIAAGVGGIAPLVFLVVTALEHRARIDRARGRDVPPVTARADYVVITHPDDVPDEPIAELFTRPQLVRPTVPATAVPDIAVGDRAALEALAVAPLRAYASSIGVAIRGSREQIRERVIAAWPETAGTG